MKNESKNVALTGVLAALAASSCCIPPVIALFAGIGGASSSLSWMEPFRPYLIGLAIVAIGYAWYNYLKPKQPDDCGCEIEKPKFYQKRGFLIGITLFAALSISFPYYSYMFYPNHQKEAMVVNATNVEKAAFEIEGMTCQACEQHIIHSVNQLDGIVEIQSSYANGNAEVEFDKSKTTIKQIEEAINSTGYSVIK
jgi:mercuric ion transport protein